MAGVRDPRLNDRRTGSPGLLEYIAARCSRRPCERHAEQSADVVLIADTYHHFEHPRAMLDEIKKVLRSDGTVLLIDFERIEGVSHPFILEMVRAGNDAVTQEFAAAGFELVEEIPLLMDEYVLRFKHRADGHWHEEPR
jgi:ubiquinone/menaquinone biosynthesis C-methylase UbiE